MATPSLRVRNSARIRIPRRPSASKGAQFEESPGGVDNREVPTAAAAHGVALSEGIGVALTILALLLVAFAAYLVGWSNLQASRNQRRLLATYAASGEFPAFHGHTPPDGSLVAILKVPGIGLRDAVVEGSTAADLELGPGLMPRTAVPGSLGDSVIAGRHGTFGSPFANLSSLRSGTVINVVDYEGSFRYGVTSVRKLPSNQSLKIAPAHEATLTLVTSRSSFPPSGLVVVTAHLLGKHGEPGAAGAPVTSSELALAGGEGWSVWQLGAWGLMLAAGLAITVVAYRRAGRPLLVYLLSTPVVLVAALFTFENLARLLPATM